jgi:hypothetical protein
MSTGTRIMRSTNGSDMFNFGFESGLPVYQEAEGLTIWDLDDGRAPGIGGQLHVLLIEKDLGDDDVFLKHYTGTIHVNGAPNPWCQNGDGSPWCPFARVTSASDMAWDGVTIKINGSTSSSYPEELTVSKRVLLQATGRPVTIGGGPGVNRTGSAVIGSRSGTGKR